MPTFRKKPEIVDARQFEGRTQHALDLIQWVGANEGHAQWSMVRGTLELYVWGRSVTVYKGYWIVLNQEGFFDTMSSKDFEEEYEQV